MNGKLILHDATAERWLCFDRPFQVITASRVEEVLPALKAVENQVNEKHRYAAGFLSYESAAAFDSALCTHRTDFPLLWFGLYPQPEEIRLPLPDFTAYSLGEPSSSVSHQPYQNAIQRIKEYISSGDTYQVNYTLRMRIPFSGDPWNLFLAMVRAQSPGYAAWIDTGRYAICSASPELFFNLDGNRVTCKPMKGTVKRGLTLKEDRELAEWLQQSAKNRAENLMIVDMIRNDLGRVADVGSVRVPRMFEVERHPTLWQMTSTVTADSGLPLTEIMAALFPCASITGAPKIRTTQIIKELEPAPRGLYTGCIGYMAPGRFAQFNVAIRTAVVDRVAGQAEYGSGGGIVWDSLSDDEYTETLLKARVLTEQRPEFRLLETVLWTPREAFFLLEYHLERLRDSAEYFEFKVDLDQVRKSLLDKATGFPQSAQKVRLLVASDGAAEIEAAPLARSKTPLRVRLARDAVNSADVSLYHKTTLRNVYESARQVFPDCDDVLLWNERGELTESCVANIVLEIDGDLFTPAVESGLLGGVFRAWLLQKKSIRERVLHIDDLARSTKVYLINSVHKWREAVVAAPAGKHHQPRKDTDRH